MQYTIKGSNKSKLIAYVLAALIVLWILSGVFFRNTQPTIKENIHNSMAVEALPKVQYIKSHAVEHKKNIYVNGITEPKRMVNLKAEVGGKITKILVAEGQKVAQGDVIMEIEERERAALLEEAKASVHKREIDYTAAKRLSLKGFQAETKLAEASSQLEMAKALLIQAQINLDNTKILSPFDGIVNLINAELGTLVGPTISVDTTRAKDDRTLAVIIDTNPIVISAFISEQNIKKITLDTLCDIELITGKKFIGKISYISKISNPVTRTFRIEIEVENPDYSIASGLTTFVSIPIENKQAHYVSSSDLSINEEGKIGVKIVEDLSDEGENQTGIVGFVAISAYDYNKGGVWISSLPPRADIITLGQAFVKEGQKVIAILSENNSNIKK